DNDVSRFDVLPCDDLVAFDHTDNEACEIVFAFWIKAWHFGGLAANEGTAIVLAGLGKTFDNFFGDPRFELADRKVIHKKHGRSALHGDVVYKMIHQIGTDSVVHVHFEGELQLGADAINTRHEDRVEVFGLVHGEEPAKSADLTQHPFGKRFVGEVFNALLGAVGLIDIDACI